MPGNNPDPRTTSAYGRSRWALFCFSLSMRFTGKLPLLIGLMLLGVRLPGQSLGSPPDFSLNATDLSAAFRLPALKDSSTGPLAGVVPALQVGMRAQALGLNGQSPLDAWTAAQNLVGQVRQLAAQPQAPPVVFTGATASALNQMLADPDVGSVRVAAAMLTLDQPVLIRRDGLILDLLGVRFAPANNDPYAVRVEGAANILVQGGYFTGTQAAVLVSSSTQVVIRDLHIQDLSGAGIVVTGSSQVLVSHNTISRVSGAPVILHRGTNSSVVEYNEIHNNLGQSNMTAGIVLSDREVDLTANPLALLGPDDYWVITQPITDRLNPPHDNVVLSNRVTANQASGIYSDGGIRNVIAENLLEGNSKEGLCLDNGSTANIVTGNMVHQNGQRWGEPDSVMALDGIADGGRLSDGTPAEKVPGISIDNAIYNIVFSNQVWRNYGGGVKMVRTAYFNLIGLNTVFSNNEGAGPTFHFFGIELGAALGESPELDFTPSRGNVIFSNPIRGSHYSGVFFGAGSDLNDIFDNVIMDAQQFALESPYPMQNSSLNNLTNLPSSNITAGLDPSLIPLDEDTTGKLLRSLMSEPLSAR